MAHVSLIQSSKQVLIALVRTNSTIVWKTNTVHRASSKQKKLFYLEAGRSEVAKKAGQSSPSCINGHSKTRSRRCECDKMLVFCRLLRNCIGEMGGRTEIFMLNRFSRLIVAH